MEQDEFIEANLDDGRLNPQHAAALLEAALSGDTANLADTGSAPTTPAGDGQTAGTQESAVADKSNSNDQSGKPTQTDGAATNNAEESPDAVILARDGVHTIPFEKLVQAREEAQTARQQAQAAMDQLAQLQEQAAQRAAAGQAPTTQDQQAAVAQAAIDAGVNPDIFGDFGREDLTKGIAQLVNANQQQFQAQVLQQVRAAIQQGLAPIQQKQATDAQTAHLNAIYAKHPDADSIVESKEMMDWVNAQPSYAQSAIEAVLQNGSTNQIIELFDRFKAETAPKTQAAQAQQQPAVDPKAAAKAAVAAAAPAVPASISDIPGGKAPGTDPQEAMAGMNGVDMLEAIQNKNWTPQQIEAFLNRGL